MPDVNMPKLSDTMEEGTIVEWKKKTGDEVKQGDVLAEVESDKATFDLEAETGGVLSILVEQGVPAKIGAPIARIGEASAAPAKEKAKAPPTTAKAKEPEAPPQVVEEPQATAKPAAPDPHPAPQAAPTSPPGGGVDGIKASPLAKRLAAEMGVDIASLKGSGPEGRVVKEDVLAAAGNKTTGERRRPTPAEPRPAGPDVEVVDPTRMQATIARRMT
jgi:pyruvate dehydrogenase E2 component (dihydrolipoamide acetyltransferase)